MVSISACHAEDLGSIPGRGVWLCVLAALAKVSLEISAVALLCKSLLESSQIRGSIVVSISACHAEDLGSIPGRGVWRTFAMTAPILR